MIVSLLLQTAALAGAPVPGLPPQLAIDGNYLLLRHLVARGDIPPDVDANMRLLEVPAGTRHIELTREAQEKLLRRRLPTLHLTPQSAGTIRLVFTPWAPREAAGRCFELRQSLPANAWVSLAEAEETSCDESRGAARLGYDRMARVPQTRTALAAGSYLGPIALPSKLPQPKSAALTLRTRVGPVTVDRTATLEQPGRAGRRAFARLSDGRIIAAPLADEGEKP